MLLSSAYGFSQTAAKVKATDYFFTGLPVLLEPASILYLHLLDFSQSANMFVLLVFAVLVFVPLRYVYPSRTETLRGLTTILASAWSSLLLWLAVATARQADYMDNGVVDVSGVLPGVCPCGSTSARGA